jgi:hypothetical protein
MLRLLRWCFGVRRGWPLSHFVFVGGGDVTPSFLVRFAWLNHHLAGEDNALSPTEVKIRIEQVFGVVGPGVVQKSAF